jgi:ABC-type Mn2+/Zn2+ transport system permease subunit
MQKFVNGILQKPAARALILFVLIIPICVYLGTTTVRRGFLYYTGILAPAAVAAIAAGLWTWSWKWFWLMLGACFVLTLLIQALFYLLW